MNNSPAPILVSLDTELPDPTVLAEAGAPEAAVTVTVTGNPATVHRAIRKLAKQGAPKKAGAAPDLSVKVTSEKPVEKKAEPKAKDEPKAKKVEKKVEKKADEDDGVDEDKSKNESLKFEANRVVKRLLTGK